MIMNTYHIPGSLKGWHRTFDTSSEAAYLDLLTQRVAAAIQSVAKKFSFRPPPNPRVHTLAVQHRQHKKRQQLIPEFAVVHWLAADTRLDDSKKIIPSSLSAG